MFFFAKKNQKTFVFSPLKQPRQGHKGFLLLFFKKEVLSFSVSPCAS